MSASKPFRSSAVRAALLGVPLLLAACGTNFGPGPMPAGYTYQGDVHKAAPGPRPHKYERNRATQEQDVQAYHPNAVTGGGAAAHDGGYGAMGYGAGHAVSTTWTLAATDLIDRLLIELGKPMETVYVIPGSFPQLEQALRDAMTGRGISVSQRQGDGPFTMQYLVSPIPNSTDVSITLLSVGSAVKEVRGVYTIDEVTLDSAIPAPLPVIYAPAPMAAPAFVPAADAVVMTPPAPPPVMTAPPVPLAHEQAGHEQAGHEQAAYEAATYPPVTAIPPVAVDAPAQQAPLRIIRRID